MHEFKHWLEAKTKAIDDELGGIPVVDLNTLRAGSLLSQRTKYRQAYCVYLEFEEVANAVT